MTHGAKVGLALSGGGFRATAFGLGCLRALHDVDLLPAVRVVSGISGGALLTAMWAYGPSDFEEFDQSVVELLRRGLQLDIAKKELNPVHLARDLAGTSASLVPPLRRQFVRKTTRTDAFRQVLDSLPFGARNLADVSHPGLTTVISATDLRTTNAVRFSSTVSACSAYGRIEDPVTVADAVAASAAFPLLLPAVEKRFSFTGRDGTSESHLVAMTDGGVYDNLGISVLLPGRSAAFTDHAYDLDYVFAVDAGRGRPARSNARLTPSRLARSFDITYRKTQDGGRAMLNAAARSGQLHGFVHAYLGMPDSRLPIPLADLIPLEGVDSYPTNFRAVELDALVALTTRGEQLMRALLDFYCRALVA